MVLSRYTLKNLDQEGIDIPDESVFELPERVLQFGTGPALRGLPDFFIDKANRQGLFNGRVVGVKLDNQGESPFFDKQDGLYTVCVRGLENGKEVEKNIINASISRVLSASDHWEQILECAHNQAMQVIISNTSEPGIQLVHDDIRRMPPASFPGKLLAFLYERFHAFDGSAKSGMVIIPTELVPDNGRMLESIVFELAHLNGLEEEFMEWLENHNHFCNSIVDCIVPERPDESLVSLHEYKFGYSDRLLTISEIDRFWAIEGNEEVRKILSFAEADDSVVVEPDINRFLELKLRLLNGSHTLCSGLAVLAGFETVSAAMEDELFASFVSELMRNELAVAIPYPVAPEVAREFGNKVLERFRNPHIRHHWMDITRYYTSKMKRRVVPVLMEYYERYKAVPNRMALGFAAYIYFNRPVNEEEGQLWGSVHGRAYPILDKTAGMLLKRWNNLAPLKLVKELLANTALWGDDLNALPGFCEAVTEKLNLLIAEGVKKTIESVHIKNS